jgi:hypothetical protein
MFERYTDRMRRIIGRSQELVIELGLREALDRGDGYLTRQQVIELLRSASDLPRGYDPAVCDGGRDGPCWGHSAGPGGCSPRA